MSIVNEDARAIIGESLVEFGNPRQDDCLERVDEENLGEKRSPIRRSINS
jgi:hypothetical protein